MSGMKGLKVTDLVGDWDTVQKLMFVFVQYTYLMYGWQSLEMTFLTPNIEVYCDGPNSTRLDACSSKCSDIKYNRQEFKTTLTEELGLVCERSWLQSFSTTILMVSGMIMNLVAGDLADRFGRRRTVILSLLPYFLGLLLVLFPQNYSMFAVGVSLIGMAYVTMANFSYVLLYELCGDEQKASMGVSMEMGFNLGAILLGGVAWALRNWFQIQVVNVALALVLALCWFLPESIEWQLNKNKSKDAVETLKKIFWVNRGPDMTDSEISAAIEVMSETYKKADEGETYSLKDLICLPKFRIKTLCTGYFWFTSAFVFYGFSLNVSVFGDNLYLSFLLSSLASFPAIIIIMVLLKFADIKWIIVGCNLLAALVSYFYGIGQVFPGYKTASVVLGWFFTSPALIMLYTFTSRLFPTEVRGKAIGLGNFMSRLGAALAPFAKELGSETRDYVPMLLFGVLCTLLVILIIRLGRGEKEFDLEETKTGRGQDNLGMDLSNDVHLVSASPFTITNQSSPRIV